MRYLNSVEQQQRSSKTSKGLLDGGCVTHKEWRFCASCLESHKHEECKKVTKRTERIELLRKFNRCFKCVNKGHISRECRARFKCKTCGGSHHISICERTMWAEVQQDQFASPSNLPVGSSSRVAFQTAQGILKGERERKKSASAFRFGWAKIHLWPLASRAMNAAKLNVVRKKWLGIKTFGGENKEGKLRQVVDFEIRSIWAMIVVFGWKLWFCRKFPKLGMSTWKLSRASIRTWRTTCVDFQGGRLYCRFRALAKQKQSPPLEIYTIIDFQGGNCFCLGHLLGGRTVTNSAYAKNKSWSSV